MNWFSGDISVAIQKAIQEKKVFIVFVNGRYLLTMFYRQKTYIRIQQFSM